MKRPKRPNRIQLSLTDAELARLDEMRPESQSRPAYLRSLIRGTRSEAGIASHNEALSILTVQARDGKTSAAIALERAIRDGQESTAADAPSEDDLDAILGA